MSAVDASLSPAWPLGSRVNEAGRLEVGGCDLVELAREFGTPAYVVAEDDLRARARLFKRAFASRHGSVELQFASKAFPCTAILAILREEDYGCDVASGGELALALKAGMDPARIALHGNAKSGRELEEALAAGVGQVVLDNFGDIERLATLLAGSRRSQQVMLRVTPDVRPETHAAIATGHADSKFGMPMPDVPRALEAIAAVPELQMLGLHMHIGSQVLDLDPFRRAVAAVAHLGPFPAINLGGGLGIAYRDGEHAPTIEAYAEAKIDAVHEHLGPQVVVYDEPGRALVASSTVTIYTVETVKQAVSTWVAVDGGMSDNLRPMLYGARYEAQLANRPGRGTECAVAGKHCESGDVIVPDADLADPRPGDVLVTPGTGAYGHAMANNYNGVPRPPVVICSGGDARVAVRRETYDDLLARDA